MKLKKVPKRWSFVEVAWNDSIRDTCGWLKAGEAVYTNTAAWLPHFTAGYLAYACKGYITVMQSKSSMQDDKTREPRSVCDGMSIPLPCITAIRVIRGSEYTSSKKLRKQVRKTTQERKGVKNA